MQTNSISLEFNGNLSVTPPVEIMAEAKNYCLTGALRLSSDIHKIIIYLKEGQVVFAVSNARQHRLYELLLSWHQITQEKLSEFENFTNDLEFADKLVKQGYFSQTDINRMFCEQISGILQTALKWEKGTWDFSPKNRIKDSINFPVDLNKILVNFARNLSNEFISKRFQFSENYFLPQQQANLQFNLNPQEAYILSRIEQKTSLNDIKILCGLPEEVVFKSLYTLFCGGFLKYESSFPIFSQEKLTTLFSTTFKLAEPVIKPLPKTEVKEEVPAEDSPEEVEVEEKIALDEETIEGFLSRIEKATNHYEVMDIPQTAENTQIKQVYFKLAKRFHPDKYHNEVGTEIHQKLQHAFTQIAQAYDTLKDKEARELYNFKLRRKEERSKLAESMPKTTEPESEKTKHIPQNQKEMAQDYFNQGFSLLMDSKFADAIPFFANAAALVSTNPKYRAYYGKALSHNSKFRYQAEQELQSAIKIDPQNPSYKIMLAEFYIEFNLFKRAEGELQRLLSSSPNNKEALSLLDNLRQKQT